MKDWDGILILILLFWNLAVICGIVCLGAWELSRCILEAYSKL